MNRRSFIEKLAASTAWGLFSPMVLSFKPASIATEHLKFGIVADVHKDLMPDADERLSKFIESAKRREVDFILQLGDFCMGLEQNREFLSIWENFAGPRYHVLGNHDMDKNSKQEMLEFWSMPKTYYSWDVNGVHFIVLDANFLYQDGKYIAYDRANFYVDNRYRTFVDPDQIAWLHEDLLQTELPTIVFSHQSLWHYQWGIKNRLAIQKILEEHSSKIICCFNGHNHIDFHHRQNQIDYIEINSMSYQWMDDKYRSTDRFPAEYYQRYKSLPNIAPYRDPLYAFASLDPGGTLTIEGVRSQWMPPSPYDLGMPRGVYGSEFTPQMSDYLLEFSG